MNLAGRLQLAAALLLTSCRPSPSPAPVQPAAAGPTASPAPSSTPAPKPPSRSPRTQAELPTTDPGIAVGNFLGLYDVTRKADAAHPKDKPPAALIGLLSSHAQFFGVLDDYARAVAAADRLVALAPSAPEAYLARAGARQALHLFDGALADLERAEALGADRDDVAGTRAGIAQARGRLDEALALREAARGKRETTQTLTAVALVLGDMGRAREADALFVRAQDLYADVSPFTLAWLYFQEGLLAERNGLGPSAQALYAAAHERLPIYAPAAGHLAAMLAARGERARAIELLEPIASVSDDPEYWGQLGALLIEDGQAERGQALVDRARKRYDELVRRWPAAFADHAARFWLGAGADPRRARALAAQNLAARPTRDAYLLVLDAAEAAHDAAAACAAADKALTLPYPTALLHLRAGKAFGRCGQAARAEAELARASAP